MLILALLAPAAVPLPAMPTLLVPPRPVAAPAVLEVVLLLPACVEPLPLKPVPESSGALPGFAVPSTMQPANNSAEAAGPSHPLRMAAA